MSDIPSIFEVNTVNYKETESGGAGSHEAITINYYAHDFGNYDDRPEDVGFGINPALIDPRLANKGFTKPILEILNTGYIPLHSRVYDDIHRDGARFWWFYWNGTKTPFMSRPNLRNLSGFLENKHDAVFVSQLCQELDEEAMNVIKAINALIAKIDNPDNMN